MKRYDCNGAYGMIEHSEGEYALASEMDEILAVLRQCETFIPKEYAGIRARVALVVAANACVDGSIE